MNLEPIRGCTAFSVNEGMKTCKGLIDPRFRTYPFVEDLQTGDFVTYIDYRPAGAEETLTSEVRLDREMLGRLTAEQLGKWIRIQFQQANEDMVDLVDGDEWDGQ